MKWVDYRVKIGLGFSDWNKFVALKNKIYNYVTILNDDRNFSYGVIDCLHFMVEIGDKIDDCYSPLISVRNVFETSPNAADLISKYVVFCNIYNSNHPDSEYDLFCILSDALDNLSMSYDLIEDEDGLFVFPKGAKELDDSLVSEPLEWLNGYPKAHSAFVKALKEYAEATDETASETADKFRKALETFFQEYFSTNKTLENLNKGNAGEKDIKGELGKYLKKQGIPSELSNDVANNLQSYTNFMNNYAKHHDKTSRKVLEYIMYQTGNIIRLLITLKQEE